MCGRFYADEDTEREIEKFVRELDTRCKERFSGDIYPSESAVVLTERRKGLEAELMEWGFPQYQKKGLLINARAETVLEKRMFRDSVLTRRCVIPAKRFYEWDAAKEKVTFYKDGEAPIFLAGFYNCFQERDRFIILTVPANASAQPVHDRMPLILEEKEVENWICDNGFAEAALQKQPPSLQRYQPYVQQSLF